MRPIKIIFRTLTPPATVTAKEDMEDKCAYCDEQPAEARPDLKGEPVLCDDCYNAYHNETGYCSLQCCITGKCDDSC